MRTALSLVAVYALCLGCEDDKQAKGPLPAPKADAPKADPDAVGPLQQAKIKSSQLQIDQVIQALDTYKVQHGAYPSAEQGLGALVDGGMLAKLPKDGWGRELVYSLDAPGRPAVTSLGADGKPGGRGPDADISASE